MLRADGPSGDNRGKPGDRCEDCEGNGQRDSALVQQVSEVGFQRGTLQRGGGGHLEERGIERVVVDEAEIVLRGALHAQDE
jgi:hypothetical protein